MMNVFGAPVSYTTSTTNLEYFTTNPKSSATNPESYTTSATNPENLIFSVTNTADAKNNPTSAQSSTAPSETSELVKTADENSSVTTSDFLKPAGINSTVVTNNTGVKPNTDNKKDSYKPVDGFITFLWILFYSYASFSMFVVTSDFFFYGKECPRCFRRRGPCVRWIKKIYNDKRREITGRY